MNNSRKPEMMGSMVSKREENVADDDDDEDDNNPTIRSTHQSTRLKNDAESMMTLAMYSMADDLSVADEEATDDSMSDRFLDSIPMPPQTDAPSSAGESTTLSPSKPRNALDSNPCDDDDGVVRPDPESEPDPDLTSERDDPHAVDSDNGTTDLDIYSDPDSEASRSEVDQIIYIQAKASSVLESVQEGCNYSERGSIPMASRSNVGKDFPLVGQSTLTKVLRPDEDEQPASSDGIEVNRRIPPGDCDSSAKTSGPAALEAGHKDGSSVSAALATDKTFDDFQTGSAAIVDAPNGDASIASSSTPLRSPNNGGIESKSPSACSSSSPSPSSSTASPKKSSRWDRSCFAAEQKSPAEKSPTPVAPNQRASSIHVYSSVAAATASGLSPTVVMARGVKRGLSFANNNLGFRMSYQGISLRDRGRLRPLPVSASTSPASANQAKNANKAGQSQADSSAAAAAAMKDCLVRLDEPKSTDIVVVASSPPQSRTKAGQIDSAIVKDRLKSLEEQLLSSAASPPAASQNQNKSDQTQSEYESVRGRLARLGEQKSPDISATAAAAAAQGRNGRAGRTDSSVPPSGRRRNRNRQRRAHKTDNDRARHRDKLKTSSADSSIPGEDERQESDPAKDVYDSAEKQVDCVQERDGCSHEKDKDRELGQMPSSVRGHLGRSSGERDHFDFDKLGGKNLPQSAVIAVSSWQEQAESPLDDKEGENFYYSAIVSDPSGTERSLTEASDADLSSEKGNFDRQEDRTRSDGAAISSGLSATNCATDADNRLSPRKETSCAVSSADLCHDDDDQMHSAIGNDFCLPVARMTASDASLRPGRTYESGRHARVDSKADDDDDEITDRPDGRTTSSADARPTCVSSSSSRSHDQSSSISIAFSNEKCADEQASSTSTSVVGDLPLEGFLDFPDDRRRRSSTDFPLAFSEIAPPPPPPPLPPVSDLHQPRSVSTAHSDEEKDEGRSGVDEVLAIHPAVGSPVAMADDETVAEKRGDPEDARRPPAAEIEFDKSEPASDSKSLSTTGVGDANADGLESVGDGPTVEEEKGWQDKRKETRKRKGKRRRNWVRRRKAAMIKQVKVAEEKTDKGGLEMETETAMELASASTSTSTSPSSAPPVAQTSATPDSNALHPIDAPHAGNDPLPDLASASVAALEASSACTSDLCSAPPISFPPPPPPPTPTTGAPTAASDATAASVELSTSSIRHRPFQKPTKMGKFKYLANMEEASAVEMLCNGLSAGNPSSRSSSPPPPPCHSDSDSGSATGVATGNTSNAVSSAINSDDNSMATNATDSLSDSSATMRDGRSKSGERRKQDGDGDENKKPKRSGAGATRRRKRMDGGGGGGNGDNRGPDEERRRSSRIRSIEERREKEREERELRNASANPKLVDELCCDPPRSSSSSTSMGVEETIPATAEPVAADETVSNVKAKDNEEDSPATETEPGCGSLVGLSTGTAIEQNENEPPESKLDLVSAAVEADRRDAVQEEAAAASSDTIRCGPDSPLPEHFYPRRRFPEFSPQPLALPQPPPPPPPPSSEAPTSVPEIRSSPGHPQERADNAVSIVSSADNQDFGAAYISVDMIPLPPMPPPPRRMPPTASSYQRQCHQPYEQSFKSGHGLLVQNFQPPQRRPNSSSPPTSGNEDGGGGGGGGSGGGGRPEKVKSRWRRNSELERVCANNPLPHSSLSATNQTAPRSLPPHLIATTFHARPPQHQPKPQPPPSNEMFHQHPIGGHAFAPGPVHRLPVHFKSNHSVQLSNCAPAVIVKSDLATIQPWPPTPTLPVATQPTPPAVPVTTPVAPSANFDLFVRGGLISSVLGGPPPPPPPVCGFFEPGEITEDWSEKEMTSSLSKRPLPQRPRINYQSSMSAAAAAAANSTASASAAVGAANVTGSSISSAHDFGSGDGSSKSSKCLPSVGQAVSSPKPDRPAHLNFDDIFENVYLSERRRSKSKREVRRMVCDCSITKDEVEEGFVACGDDCLNRLLMMECGSRCPTGDRCTNRRFQKRQYANIVEFKTEKKGWGLKTKEDLPAGTFVLEYVGEVLDQREFKRRVREYAHDRHRHYYFMALRNDEIIDATQKGNLSRFINHSCDPNCETQKWTVNGELRVGFFTRHAISGDDELTFDYQFQRYGKEAQKCYCEAPNCRGFIGGDKQTPLKKDRRDAKRRKAAQERRREELEDMDLEQEIEKFSQLGGLKNRNQTLNLCRLMVRADDVEFRLVLLQSLQKTTEQACLRLFLDYHGLSLLWSWMVDIGNTDDNLALKSEVLKTLHKLPITNKNVLMDSKVLAVVQKWSAQIADQARRPPSGTIEEEAEPAAAAALQENRSPPMLTKENGLMATEDSCCSDSDSSQPVPSIVTSEDTSSEALIVGPTNSVPCENDTVKSELCRVSEIVDDEDHFDEVRSILEALVSKASNEGEFVVAKGEAKYENADDQVAAAATAADDDILRCSTTEEAEQAIEEGELVSPFDEEPSRTKEEEPDEDDEADADGDAEETAPPVLSNEAQLAERSRRLVEEGEFANLAKELLGNWSNLKEVYRIPKREQNLNRREHEREADKREGEERERDSRDKYRDSRDHNRDHRDRDGRHDRSYGDRYDYDQRAKCHSSSSSSSRSDYDRGRRPRDSHDSPSNRDQHRKNRDRDRRSRDEDEPERKRPFHDDSRRQRKVQRRREFEQKVKEEEDAVRTQQNQMNLVEQYQMQERHMIERNMMSMDQQQQQPPVIFFDPHYGPLHGPHPPGPFNGPPPPSPRPGPIHGPPPPHPGQMHCPPPPHPGQMHGPCPPQSPVTMSGPPGTPMPYFEHNPSFIMPPPPMPPPMPMGPPPADQMLMVSQIPTPDAMIECATPSSTPSPIANPSATPAQIIYPVYPPPGPPPPVPPGFGGQPQPGPGPHFIPLPQGQPPPPPGPTAHFIPPSQGQPIFFPSPQTQTVVNIPEQIPWPAHVLQTPILEDGSPLAEPPKKPVKPAKLPPNWKSTTDEEGATYYYHSVTRKTQWDPPTCEESDMDLGTPTHDEHEPKKKKKGGAVQDGSSESARRIKEGFRMKMSQFIVQCLNPYRKPDCKMGRIGSTDEFKHLARKLTHFVMAKELKHCRNVEDLECNDNVKHKAKDFVRKYMSKFGPIYKKSPKDDDDEED